MRQEIYEYVCNNTNTFLLHCDMFPYKHERIFDLSLCEFSILNVAIGLRLSDRKCKVIIFGVNHFIIDKLIYSANLHDLSNIYIVNGGSAFVYHPYPHHILYNDLYLMKSVTPYLFAPRNKDALFSILDKDYNNLVYIRLMPETLPQIRFDKIVLNIPVFSYGWIYEILSKYVSPMYEWDFMSHLPFESVLIEDHCKWQQTQYWFGLTENHKKHPFTAYKFLQKAYAYLTNLKRR